MLLLVHPHYRPDQTASRASTELDVWRGLRRLGHAVTVAAVADDARAFERQLTEVRPHVVFNLLEEFRGEGAYDFHLVSRLEALGVPCTGCNPRGLIISRNKWLVTAAAGASNVPTPETARGATATAFPAFVKFNREHASRGITRANVVRGPEELMRAAARLRRNFPGELITQAFVRGTEVSVGVWGNARPEALPPRALRMAPDRVATERLKFDARYRRRIGVRATAYLGPASAEMSRHARRLYAALDLSGYARFDFRVSDQGPFLIDVNANPNLSVDEDFARAARGGGRRLLRGADANHDFGAGVPTEALSRPVTSFRSAAS